ncbi:hypothetical protein LB507_006671 [Fusarium sp. FIESC RH6]|nr:hypothetical protein LB507_006671 [Fusarium sp. FIESC RH6]
MGSREINIEFTKEQIEMYNGKGYRLCFGIGVGQNPAFNVIAQATTITPEVTFQWNDEFRIAATNDRFENGGTLSTRTSLTNIKFDQVYTLPPT